MDNNKTNDIYPANTELIASSENSEGVSLEQEAQNMAKADKIHWLGVDGALLALFAGLVITMFCSLYFKIDVLSGYVFPIVLLVIVCVVTFAYLRTLGGFIKKMAREGREKKDE
jgi:hypothetical protein